MRFKVVCTELLSLILLITIVFYIIIGAINTQSLLPHLGRVGNSVAHWPDCVPVHRCHRYLMRIYLPIECVLRVLSGILLEGRLRPDHLVLSLFFKELLA